MATAHHEQDWETPTRSGFSGWLWFALVLSLLAHVGFWHWARGYSFGPDGREYYERIVPRAFHLERVNIDPELLKPDPADEKRPALAPEAVKLPEDKPAFEKLMAENKGEPAAPKIDQPMLSEKPSANATTYEDAAKIAETSGAKSILEDRNSLQNALLTEKPQAGGVNGTQILDPQTLPGKAIANAGPLRGGNTPGFSNLDDLLAQTGPLSAETAPIRMEGDVLFEYGQYSLTAGAMVNLAKLGQLIQRNPQATFIIEGHTDSFGSDEFNMELSRDRAAMVKLWLVREMQIPENRIETRGYGKTRLIAPATGSQEEQSINRRVEIVIRTKNP